MTHAIRIHANGGPEVMQWEVVPTPEPGPGEVLVKHDAIGLNYIDVYFRSGLYKAPSMPTSLGMEGAGVVLAVGSDVTGFATGDRVAYGSGALGAYATHRVIGAERLVKLPDSIDSKTAAAMMLQGMTAQYLVRRTYKIKPGDTVVVHAAAGGVGLIMCQWAKHLGATVIGVVSTPEKAELAHAHGAAHTVIGHADLVATVKKVTGADVVFLQIGTEPTVGAENQDIGDARDHRRYGERQIDQSDERALAAEFEFRDGPGGHDTKYHVGGHGDGGHQQRQLDRRPRRGVGDRSPICGQSPGKGLREHHDEGQQQEGRHECQRDADQQQAAPGCGRARRWSARRVRARACGLIDGHGCIHQRPPSLETAQACSALMPSISVKDNTSITTAMAVAPE